MDVGKWFHKLFNPHCADCLEEELRLSSCDSCETLRSLLDASNYEKKQLLQAILDFNKVNHEVKFTETPSDRPEQIVPKNIPWHVRRQMLETEDRKTAELIAKKKKEAEELKKIEDLEKELKIEVPEGGHVIGLENKNG